MFANHVHTGPAAPGLPVGFGPGLGLQPGRTQTDNLTPGDGARVWCTALMLDRNRMAVTAGGLEQTRITYGFTRLMAKYDGLYINGVKTQRTDGDAAQSFFVLSHVSGEPTVLHAFGEEITNYPWFEPGGRRIEAKAIVDVTVIARDRTGLLMDELEIVSGQYEANIETLVNLHYDEPKYHGLLKPAGRFGPGGGGGRGPARKYTPFVSVTRMRLELEHEADIRPLLRDLRERGQKDRQECGTEWTVLEEGRPKQATGPVGYGGPN